MHLYKVSCSRCPSYAKCPTRTKMFVNYCGTRSHEVRDEIRQAIAECRERRGHLFQRISVATLRPRPVVDTPSLV
jgi:hypothetical protein